MKWAQTAHFTLKKLQRQFQHLAADLQCHVAALAQEIEAPQRIYEAARDGLVAKQCLPPTARIAPRLTLFRFPYGACNPQAIRAVNDAGLVAIQWDLSTGDPSPGTTAQAIISAMNRA